jgi:hypothetical protein
VLAALGLFVAAKGLVLEARPLEKRWSGRGPLGIEISLVNGTRQRQSIDFRSAEMFDLELRRAGAARPVWRYGADRMHAQVVTNLVLKPGERRRWTVTLDPSSPSLRPGQYTAVPKLGATLRPVAVRTVAGKLTVVDRQASSADITGRIETLFRNPGGGVSILVVAKPGKPGLDRASVFVGARTPGSSTLLKVGQQVQVWFTGPIRESYPPQATAGRIVVVK